MTDQSILKLTIAFVDPELDAAEQDKEAQELYSQTRYLDAFESVSRVRDSNIPERSLAGGGLLNGLLTLKYLVNNTSKISRFLGKCLKNKSIEVEVSPTGKKQIFETILKNPTEEEVVAMFEVVKNFALPSNLGYAEQVHDENLAK
jgi:hypothetical protein